jgi:hypothetical protein
MNIPRDWLGFQAQEDPSQIASVAIPTAMDVRFKIGAILAFVAWLFIPFSLWHSIKHYKPNARTRFLGRLRAIPPVFLLTIPLSLVIIGYAEAQGWLWSINVGRDNANDGYLYGLGYGPAVLILYFNIMAGLHYPNEDLELMRQRVVRGRALDAELGIDRRSRKPWWWSRVANEIGLDNDAKLRALASEAAATQGTRRQNDRAFEMRNLAQSHLNEETAPTRGTEYGVVNTAGNGEYHDLPSPNAVTATRPGLLDVDSIRTVRGLERENSFVSFGSQTTAISETQTRPQQVRSMLDV